MPKQRITREMVLDAAFSIAREQGMEQVLVKNIAGRLGCSVQPIYSYCQSMEALREEVTRRAHEVARAYVAERVDAGDRFRSTGRAWLELAQREPQLFRLFLAYPRRDVASWDELYRAEADPRVAGVIADSLGLDADAARRLHLQLLVYTVGLGTIFSTTQIPAEEVFARQEDAYEAFFRQAKRKENAARTAGASKEEETDE